MSESNRQQIADAAVNQWIPSHTQPINSPAQNLQTPQTMNTPSDKLLACPFCGGQYIPEHPKMKDQFPFTSEPKLEELTEGGWRVTCYGCGVSTWSNLNYTKAQAVSAWNTRP